MNPQSPQPPTEALTDAPPSRAPQPTPQAATGETSGPHEAAETDATAATRKTARQKIAALLWWSVPSSTDEEAKTRTAQMLDAHRAEVLREAERKAREIVAKLWGDGTTQTQLDRAGGARAVEWEIGLMASGNDEAAAVPDFFQPGHSYTHRNGSTFTCVAVTTHPDGGERVALGWHTDTAGWTFVGVRNINHWNHEYDGVQPPAEAGEAR